MSDMVNIGALDLNRLRVLHTVLELRSVTRAAAALHVTPAAVSNALAQLREDFGDPLVVRSGRGLALTPRAEELAPILAAAMAAIAKVTEVPAKFDPAQTTRTFTIACSDAEQLSEIPRIAVAFSRKLPRAQLEVLSVPQLEARGGLAAGAADVALAPAERPPEPGSGIHVCDLYEEEGVLVVRKGHPRVRGKMTRALFNELRHIDIHVGLGGGGIGHRIVDQFFAAHGLRRDIALSVPSFAAAATIAAQTDWVTGMPRRMVEVLARQLPLTPVEMPIPSLQFRIQLVWHERTDTDAGARFFRELVTAAVTRRR